MKEIPDPLKACIDKFWNDNPELKVKILQDLYVHGRVCIETSENGVKAVDIWLKNPPLPNGERP
jgi:hypothetical protein